MKPASWPRSTLPADRDNRFNILADAICGIYRLLKRRERIRAVTVAVEDTDGAVSFITRDAAGTRRLEPAEQQDEAGVA